MRKNNFDTSSSGVNLEISCFYDLDSGKNNFDEHFFEIQKSNNTKNSIYAYIPNGLDVSEFEKEYDLKNSNYLFKKYASYIFEKEYSLIGDYEIEELVSELEFYGYAITPLSDCDCSNLKDAIFYHQGQSKENLEDFLSNNFEPTYKTLVSRGYSQSDFAEVIFVKEVIDYMRENYETCKDMSDDEIVKYNEKDVGNYLWDQPVTALLEVNSHLINLSDFLSDLYIYSEEEIVDGLKKYLSENNLELSNEEISYINSWLEENLPIEPNHF